MFVCFIVRPFVVSGDIVLIAGAEMFVRLKEIVLIDYFVILSALSGSS